MSRTQRAGSNTRSSKRGSTHDKVIPYHLRFQIVPGENVVRHAQDLVRFCTRHDVDEVVLFFAAEGWSQGLLSGKEEDRWFSTVAEAKKILEDAGITVSLNPWATSHHGDRGRSLPADRKIRPMVSPSGQASRSCASFADPNWLRYITGLYGRFASLGFRVLWIEDDFRYHNHNPITWGGGFEAGVLRRFSAKVGKRRISRSEVVHNILKPGRPHPWRALWMETWREIQLEAAGAIAKSVKAAAPGESKLGLMSSSEEKHSIEGRNFLKLFSALQIEGDVAHRPSFASYGDAGGRAKSGSILRLDLQRNFRPPDCEVAPEVENYPFTRWSKSDTQTWAEMCLCAVFGSDALLLDLFPFSGNPPSTEPDIGLLLDRSRPALKWFSGCFSKTMATRGVGLPWREDAQAHVRTSKGRSLDELDASVRAAANLLNQYGIPIAARAQSVNAVFGSLAWSFPDKDLKEMLGRGLLLDGVAASILKERGYGKHIGVKHIEILNREDALYSLERVVNGKAGATPGYKLNVNKLDSIARIVPDEGAREMTEIMTPGPERFGSGLLWHRNSLGGRVAVTPSGFGVATYAGQAMLQSTVAFLARGRFRAAFVTGGPYLLPVHLKGQKGHKLVIINGCPDPARPIIRLPERPKSAIKATLLEPLAKPIEAKVRRTPQSDGVCVAATHEVPSFGFLVMEWR